MRLARALDATAPGILDSIAATRRRVMQLQEQDGRRVFLLAQLGALERRARFLAGQPVPIREEAAALGLAVPPYDASRAAGLRAELESALPGPGALAERLAAHQRASALPRSRLDRVAHAVIDDCRSRMQHVPGDLFDAGVELTYVIERPWRAYTSYRDNGLSTVEIRRDVVWHQDDLLTVLCHETYAGHHLQNLVWDDLRDARGWVEFGVTPMLTPHGVMAERSAVSATDLVIPRASRPAVSRILEDFAPLAVATAVATADGEIERATGIARLRDEVMMPDAEGFLAFVERYRSMAVAYVTPAPGVRDWSSYLALLRSPERLVAGAM